MKRRVFFGGALALVGSGVQTGPGLEYWKKRA
jgi:hypothetical protein